MGEKEVVAILAHVVLEDTIRYRVHYTNGQTEWVIGSELEAGGSSFFLLRYWRGGGRELRDRASQTEPCRIFDFSSIQDQLLDLTDAFVEFPFVKPVSRTSISQIPLYVSSIDVRKGEAYVKFRYDEEPCQMDLAALRQNSPELIAQYFMSKRADGNPSVSESRPQPTVFV
jgi:hypothetical protein